jgi:hypothetical protein
MADEFPARPPPPPRLTEARADLLGALWRLVRGLAALFWGLPIALVVCVQTAKGDWLQPLGVLPPLVATGLMAYGLRQLGYFQKQERVWVIALDRALLFALVNVGLSPFLYWWNRFPNNLFYSAMVELLTITGLLFLFSLNPVLWRLAAMLPDETLRLETKLFTTLNRFLLSFSIAMLVGYFLLERARQLPPSLVSVLVRLEKAGLWLLLFLILLPFAMTMALIWKIKEVILASVFAAKE